MLALCRRDRRRDSFWMMVGGVRVTMPQTSLVAVLTKLYISSMHGDSGGYFVMLLVYLCVQMAGTVNMAGRYLMRRLTQCQRASREDQRNQYVSM